MFDDPSNHFSTLCRAVSCRRQSDSLPPSLAFFSHADPSVVVYTGFGVEKEISFYSLVKKQVAHSDTNNHHLLTLLQIFFFFTLFCTKTISINAFLALRTCIQALCFYS